MNPLRLYPHFLPGLLVLFTTLGCASGKGDGWKFTKSLDIRRAVGLKKDELAPPQIPARIVSTWQDTVVNKPGEASLRGFGGRLLFFNQESEDPVRVEGQLVVYAFDDGGRAEHETHPTRRYVFPAEQFARHESECKLGPSYSVWLPWDAVGGEQKNISLIARFEPIGGPLVAGDQTKHLLPGTRQLASGETAPPTEPVSGIQLTQFTQTSQIEPPVAGVALGKQRAQITSISLSQKDWEQRLAAAKAASANASTVPTAPESATAPTTPGLQ